MARLNAHRDAVRCHIAWQRAVRIIPSRFPAIGPFDSVADPDDLQAVYAVEAATNPRLLQAWGKLDLVAPKDRISGLGTSPIMAAFTHPNPEGSRFSDGSYGVYYASHDEATAIAETVYHRQYMLRVSHAVPMKVEMRQYIGGVDAQLVDLRDRQDDYPGCYELTDYSHSQSFGIAQKLAGRAGIVYDSVRRQSGICLAIFKPRALHPVTQSKHYYYVWNGEKISDVLNVSRF